MDVRNGFIEKFWFQVFFTSQVGHQKHPEAVGGSHVHAEQRSHVHANDLWEMVACTRGQVRNYTRIGDVHFLLIKNNENRNLWYMCCFYLQPCVEVGLSRLSVRPSSQLHANRKRL